MKFLRLSSPIFVFLCILLLIPGTSLAVWKRNKSKGLKSSRFMTVRTTAYTHSESDHIVYGRKNALDTRLKSTRKYTSAAADWSRFPVGTTFKIKGLSRTFVIDDYGSALVGTDTIDLYQTSRKAMNKWGVQHVQIEILKWGDYDKSREVLQERKGYSHIRKMLVGINNPKKRRSSPFLNTTPATLPPEPEATSPATNPIGGGGGPRQFRAMEVAFTPAVQNPAVALPPTTIRPIARPVYDLPEQQTEEPYVAASQYPAASPDLPPNRVKRNPLAVFGRKLFGRERTVASRPRNFRPIERTVAVAISEPVNPVAKPASLKPPYQACASATKRKSRNFRPIAPGS